MGGTKSLVVAAFYFCAPVIGLTGASSYNDAAGVFFLLAAVYLLLEERWFDAGFCAGFCCGCRAAGGGCVCCCAPAPAEADATASASANTRTNLLLLNMVTRHFLIMSLSAV